MKMHALKFVRFDGIEDHFKRGWVASIPNAPMHHHHYGIELAWICDCPVPGGFKTEYPTAFPKTDNRANANERTEHRANR